MPTPLPLPPSGVGFIDPITGGVSVQWQNYLLQLSSIGGGFAPIDAEYWVSTPDATLTNVTNLGALASGYVKLTTAAGVGTPSTVATIPGTDITGAALSKTDDTNVTATLTGTPTTALLRATNLALGWTGTLSVARGGIGVGTLASNGVLYGNGISAVQALVVNGTATNKYLQQVSSGAPSWQTIPASEITNGAALTKTDDTNVTLTLGGTPSSALLTATSLTLGWTGTLGVTRGGTGTGTTFTQGSVIFAGASGIYAQDNANFFWDDAISNLVLGGDATIHGLKVGRGSASLIENTAVGNAVLSSVTVGVNNTGGGYQTLTSLTGGTNNTGWGFQALYSLTTGADNTADGYQALYSLTTGTTNCAVGLQALYSLTTGTFNTAVGVDALHFATTPSYNVAIGVSALRATTSGSSNTGIGTSAIATNTTGVNNTSIGANSLVSLLVGDSNVSLGYYAGAYETGSNHLYIDNQDRTNTAGDISHALLYGTFNAAPANQHLRINTADFLVTANTGTIPSAAALSAYVHVVGADGVGSRLVFDTFAAVPIITFRRANGISTAQTSLLANDAIASFAANGYTGAAYSGAKASITMSASENWTATANGTHLAFSTTTNLATTNTERVRIDNAGSVGINSTNPSATAMLHVVSTNAVGLQINASTNDGSSTAGQLVDSTGQPLFSIASDGLARFFNNGTERVRITATGNIGIGTITPSAILHIKAGTATASTAPLKFTSGVNLTTPEAGAVEFTTDDFYATITTGAARKGIILNNGSNLTSGKIPVATTNGRLTDSTAALLTAGGVANIVASTFEKAETGTDVNVLTYTTNASTDEFLVAQIATDISALTGTSVAVTATWKDSNNATATSTITLSGVGDGTINIPMNALKSTTVVISTVFVGVSTAYNISAFLTRLK